MDGMLSQDEINALLSGMNMDDDPKPEENPSDSYMDNEILTDTEKDAIGEIGNISMGTSATTLYSLVNRKVSITTPAVKLSKWEEVSILKERPCVFIQINYTTGLDGTNILVLRDQDVKIITDLMMGGDGTNVEGELGELHLSAISEAMNQMMGSAATSLASMIGEQIDISPPISTVVTVDDSDAPNGLPKFLKETFVEISFRMQIGDLVDSTIMQLYPLDFAKRLVYDFMHPAGEKPEEKPLISNQVNQPQMNSIPVSNMQPQNGQQPQMGMGQQMGQQPQMGMGQQPQMGMGQQMRQQPQMGMGQQMQNMNVQPAQFQSFSSYGETIAIPENIELIKDVPLEVTVELGRTKKSISEILDFAPGTIIELDKIAGEPIDVLVNGKFVARGEVVVIEESFGIRVTEIIK